MVLLVPSSGRFRPLTRARNREERGPAAPPRKPGQVSASRARQATRLELERAFPAGQNLRPTEPLNSGVPESASSGSCQAPGGGLTMCLGLGLRADPLRAPRPRPVSQETEKASMEGEA